MEETSVVIVGSAGLLVGLVVVSVLPLIWHFMYGRRCSGHIRES